MSELLSRADIEPAAAVLRADLVENLRRLVVDDSAVKPRDRQHFIARLADVEHAINAMAGMPRSYLAADIREILNDASRRPSPAARLLAAWGWEKLADPDTALIGLTDLAVDPGSDFRVHQVVVDCIRRLDPFSRDHEAEAERLAQRMRRFAPGEYQLSLMARVLVSIPGCADVMNRLILANNCLLYTSDAADE